MAHIHMQSGLWKPSVLTEKIIPQYIFIDNLDTLNTHMLNTSAHVGNSDIHVTAQDKENWNSLLNGGSTSYNVTLLGSGWSSIAPYEQSVTVTGLLPTDIVIVSPQPVQATLEIVSDCLVVADNIDTNSLRFKAFNGKPTSDIIFTVVKGGI